METLVLALCILVVAPDESAMTYESPDDGTTLVVADRRGQELRQCSFRLRDGQEIQTEAHDLGEGFAKYVMRVVEP